MVAGSAPADVIASPLAKKRRETTMPESHYALRDAVPDAKTDHIARKLTDLP